MASTFTSTSCAATIGAQTVSQTNPSDCNLQGTAANGVSYYVLIASAQATVGAQSVNGYDGYEGLQTSVQAFGSPDVKPTVDATAMVSQEFSSTGPQRMGAIIFTGSCTPGQNTLFIAACNGTITLSDSLGTNTFAAPACLDPAFEPCQTQSFPIELGTTFSVEDYFDNNTTANNGVIFYSDPAVTFALQQNDRTLVDVQLAPEPSSWVLAGLGLAAICWLKILKTKERQTYLNR